jgi:N-acetylglucosaminyldiphosphoundecaprenol N-acetyl-beta-D-mannosaminyltransferase
VLAARRDRRILDALNSFDTVLADGIAVVWGARYLGIRVPERLGTDDVALEVMEACGRLGLGLYFLGADPGVAERAAANLRQRLPRLKVVGTHHGWFEPEKDAQIVEIINTSGADCLLVCLGTPRQQLWVAKNAPKLHARLIMTGGGYLDHLAEAVDWYPKWIHRLKLNWLYRLWREPRRLWRRYTIELLEFAWLVVHARKSAQAQG